MRCTHVLLGSDRHVEAPMLTGLQANCPTPPVLHLGSKCQRTRGSSSSEGRNRTSRLPGALHNSHQLLGAQTGQSLVASAAVAQPIGLSQLPPPGRHPGIRAAAKLPSIRESVSLACKQSLLGNLQRVGEVAAPFAALSCNCTAALACRKTFNLRWPYNQCLTTLHSRTRHELIMPPGHIVAPRVCHQV